MKTNYYNKNPKKILGYLIAFAIVFLNYNPVFSQCIMSSQYGSATVPAPGAPTVTISTCNYQTEYSPLYGVVGGYSYSCENVTAGGYITITEGTPAGTVVNHGASPLTWTATTSGTHYVHWAVNSFCATATGCNVTTVSFISAGGTLVYGCTNQWAVNYDSTANVDDGSCVFPGCTDPFATNYCVACNADCDTIVGGTNTSCCIYPVANSSPMCEDF